VISNQQLNRRQRRKEESYLDVIGNKSEDLKNKVWTFCSETAKGPFGNSSARLEGLE
jgi:hypothetical protein